MRIFQQIWQKLRLIKLERLIGALVYPINRSWLGQQTESSQSVPTVEAPGRMNRATSTTKGGKFSFGHLELEIHFLAPDLVRVDWKPSTLPVSYGIVDQDWAEVETTTELTDNGFTIASSCLKVVVHLDGSLEFQSADGQILRQELVPRGMGRGWFHFTSVFQFTWDYTSRPTTLASTKIRILQILRRNKQPQSLREERCAITSP